MKNLYNHSSLVKPVLISLFLLSAISIAHADDPPDGGMYPITMLDKIPLKQAGIKINNSDIFNPNGTGLLQAIVQIGGCTGSFVSGEGLIITNHHCAFGSLAPYSTQVNDLFEKGYLAKSRKLELPMKGLTCKIMESHTDVSPEVLKGTDTIADPIRKQQAIANNMDMVQQLAQVNDTKLKVEISEMVPGKSYVLFRYKVIRDLRIVYIPARNIGEFGGETDNWVWPRHTGDFSFVRAYVGKDGEGAAFDSANVPYEPKEYLNINATGVAEGDFVFILGYPGRTYRQEPAGFLKYQQDYELPFIAELYEWQINTMQQLGKTDPKYKLSQEPKIKSLANVMKNYQGKLQGLQRLDLYKAKRAEDAALADKITDPALKLKYLQTLKNIDQTYCLAEQEYKKYAWYIHLLGDNYFIKIAHVVDLYKTVVAQNRNPEEKERQVYVQLLRTYYKGMYARYDSMLLVKMLTDAHGFDDKNRPDNIEDGRNGYDMSLQAALASSHLLDSSFIFDIINNKPARILKIKSPFVNLAHSYYQDYMRLDSVQTRCKLQLDNLEAVYIDIKMRTMQEQFIPDANRTLRLTYGYIKGYSPRDGVYYEPFTTVRGMIEKNGENPDYKANDSLLKIFKQNIANEQAAHGDVPLCLLYNTDTTGGNSGSPVLNKYGELIGLNFDRNYEATINDYAWNDKYSRSIGLDMRFVLWQLSKVNGGQNILDEMFVDN